jgi:hypothetical protein
MPIPAALPIAIQGVTGIGQLIGSMFKKTERPEYEIPSALRSALGVAQTMVNNPFMAGYSQAVDQANLASSNMITAAQQSGGAQQSLASIAASQGTQLRELAQMNEVSNQQDLENLQRVLDAYSRSQDQQWQMNEFAPYADKMQEKRDVFGAGLENLFGAASSFATIGQAGGLANKAKALTQITAGGLNIKDIMSGFVNMAGMASRTGGVKKPG